VNGERQKRTRVFVEVLRSRFLALLTADRLPYLPMRALLPMIVLTALVAGCGYKTPLTLPKPKPEAQKPEAPAPIKPDEKKPAS